MVRYAIRVNDETLPLVLKITGGDTPYTPPYGSYIVLRINMRGEVTWDVFLEDHFFLRYRNADKIPVFQILRD